MKVEKAERGYVIGQEYLSFIELERVCKEIDDAIATKLPDHVMITGDVVKFVIKHYKKRLGERIVYLSDKVDY